MDEWGAVLLSNGVAATVLAAIALLAGRLRGSAALVHGLWVLVLIKLVTPPLFCVEIEPSQLGLQPESVASVAEMPGPAPSPDVVQRWEPSMTAAAVPTTPDVVDSADRSSFAAPVDWWAIARWAWLAGSVVLVTVALVRVARFRRLLATAAAPDRALRRRIERLAAKLELAALPRIAIVDARVSPMVWCFLGRPHLVLPRGLLAQLDDSVTDTLIAHELAHLRRGDHWIRHVELVVCALHWWNPLVWWAAARLHAAEEECCDAWVVWALPRGRRRYAEALVGTVEFLNRNRSLPVAASGVGRIDDLKRRITMIMQGQSSRALSRPARLALSGFAVLFLTMMPVFAQQSDEARIREAEEHIAQREALVADLEAHITRLRDRVNRLEQASVESEEAGAQLAELSAEIEARHAEIANATCEIDRLRARIHPDSSDRSARGTHEITIRVAHDPHRIAEVLDLSMALLMERGEADAAHVVGSLAQAMAQSKQRSAQRDRARNRAARDVARDRATMHAERGEFARIAAQIEAEQLEARARGREQRARAEEERRRAMAERDEVHEQSQEVVIRRLHEQLADVVQQQNHQVHSLERRIDELTVMVQQLAEIASPRERDRRDNRRDRERRRRDDDVRDEIR